MVLRQRDGQVAVNVFPKCRRDAVSRKYWFRPLTGRSVGDQLCRQFEPLVPMCFPARRSSSRVSAARRYPRGKMRQVPAPRSFPVGTGRMAVGAMPRETTSV